MATTNQVLGHLEEELVRLRSHLAIVESAVREEDFGRANQQLEAASVGLAVVADEMRETFRGREAGDA